jgi:hypothetical protein
MKSPRRCAIAAALLLAFVGSSHVPADKVVAPKGETPTAKSETRLRKLHLVRPDLIPYPIAFEVYC